MQSLILRACQAGGTWRLPVAAVCAAATALASSVAACEPELTPVQVVGGHSGIMHNGAMVYKPVQKGRRGMTELHFYERHCAPGTVQPPCNFMPAFFGSVVRTERPAATPAAAPLSKAPSGAASTTSAAAADVVETRYMLLENLTHGYKRPCVMDIKVGKQTWDEDAPEAKVRQEITKYPPQQVVGFRFTGMRVWQRGGSRPATGSEAGSSGSGGWYKEHGRTYGYSLDERTLINAFYEYLHDGTRLRVELIPPLLGQLEEIRRWFLHGNDRFRFYGSSLLFVYEGCAEGDADCSPGAVHAPAAAVAVRGASASGARVQTRMIDFAHVWPIQPGSGGHAVHGDRDGGYITGIESVIGYLNRLQELHGAPTAEAGGAVVGDASAAAAAAAVAVASAMPPAATAPLR